MNFRLHLKMGLATALYLSLCGCDTSRNQATAPSIASNLVFPSDELLTNEDEQLGLWDSSRNDFRMGGSPNDDLAAVRLVDVHQREWLWISNGQPREYSSVLTRSVKRGVAP